MMAAGLARLRFARLVEVSTKSDDWCAVHGRLAEQLADECGRIERAAHEIDQERIGPPRNGALRFQDGANGDCFMPGGLQLVQD